MRHKPLASLAIASALYQLLGIPALAQAPAGIPQGSERIILSLGKDAFIPKGVIEATADVKFQADLAGLRFLDEVSVIILADIPFGQLPPVLQSSLGRWVELGGSLLVTGGNNSFGLGGYADTPLGALLPLIPRSPDRLGHGFSPTLVLQPSHPIFSGVTTTTMANFNETTLAGDATLLLEYRGASKAGFAGAGMTGGGRTFLTTVNPKTGQAQVTLGTPAQSLAGQVTNPVTGQVVQAGPGSGTASTGLGGAGQGSGQPAGTSGGSEFNPTFASEGGIQGGGRAVLPLVAERRQGQGLVLAIAVDMNATGDWPDRDRLMANAVRYLLEQSRLRRVPR